MAKEKTGTGMKIKILRVKLRNVKKPEQIVSVLPVDIGRWLKKGFEKMPEKTGNNKKTAKKAVKE